MANKTNRPGHQPDFDAIRHQAEDDIRNDLGLDIEAEANSNELEDLGTELGLQEVYLEEADLDTIAADDTDDNLDADDDGIEDDIDQEEVIDDRPQALTESYGTGLQGRPSDRAGRYSRRTDDHLYTDATPIITGGDVDANYEQAVAVGEEAVGGTVSTPDQDIVEDLAAAVGIATDDRSYLRTNDMLEQRDDRRWELDPQSSEDYENRHDD